MKKRLLYILFLLIVFSSVTKAQWVQLPKFAGTPRDAAASFSLGDTGYIVAGGSSGGYLSDAWRYDSYAGVWTQIANYPGGDQNGIRGFSLDGYGFAGTGAGPGYSYSNSFYKYFPATNTWVAIANLPGSGRNGAVTFVLDGKAYVGGGFNGFNNNPLNDFYAYDEATNTWSTIASCPAKGVSFFAAAFVIGDKAYVGTGGQQKVSGSSTFDPVKDFWEYDTTSKIWTQVADFGGSPVLGAVGQGGCDYGYVGTGALDSLQSNLCNSFWRYEPGTNTWSKMDTLAGVSRYFASSFYMNKTLFVGCGQTADSSLNTFYSYIPIYKPGYMISQDTVCEGQTITFTDTTSWGPTNHSWLFPGGTPDTSSQPNPTIEYDTVGTYYVYMSAWNGCDSNFSVGQQVVINNCGSPVVWPGDANDDLYVNNYDLLPIGLYYNNTGPARDTTTIAWAPHPATVWGTSQNNGKDMRYVDCNGDGTINATDTTAIVQNYGLYHAMGTPPKQPEIGSGAPLYFIADSGSYHPGSLVHIAVWLGNNNTQVSKIYGIGYNVALNTSVIENGSLAFNYHNSFLGTKNSNALSLVYLNNDVETAVTGITHHNQNGYGQIGDLYFKLQSSLSAQNLVLSISSYQAVDSAGNAITLSAQNDTIMVDGTTGINQLSLNNNQLIIYPNPASNQLTVSSNQLSINAITITNVLGQVVYKTEMQNLGLRQTIDVSSLADEMYFVTVGNINGVITSKVVVQK